jgi:hypothetical protein
VARSLSILPLPLLMLLLSSCAHEPAKTGDIFTGQVGQQFVRVIFDRGGEADVESFAVERRGMFVVAHQTADAMFDKSGTVQYFGPGRHLCASGSWRAVADNVERRQIALAAGSTKVLLVESDLGSSDEVVSGLTRRAARLNNLAKPAPHSMITVPPCVGFSR